MSHLLIKMEDVKQAYDKNLDIATSRFRQLLIEPQYIGEMPVHLLRNLAKDK